MNADFIVPMNGLAQGRKSFRWCVGDKFFEGFENSEILAADILVDADVEKSGAYIGVDCVISGEVTVVCDRCLGDLVLPVETGFKLSVKFGEGSQPGETEAEGEREIVFLPESDADLDLSQIVYDYVCLSLPVQRMHDESACDPEVLRFLSSGSPKPARERDSSSPFAALKVMLDKEGDLGQE